MTLISVVVAAVITAGGLYTAWPNAVRLAKAIARVPLRLVRAARRLVRRTVRGVRAIARAPFAIAALEAKVTHEFSNNGGSTMRDRVDAIQLGQVRTHVLAERAVVAAERALTISEATARAGGVDLAELDERVTRLEGGRR